MTVYLYATFAALAFAFFYIYGAANKAPVDFLLGFGQPVFTFLSPILPEGTLIGQYGQVSGDQELASIYTQGNQFSDQLTAVQVGPYTAKTGEVLARVLADNLDLEVQGQSTAGLGTLDQRSIRSRGERANYGVELFDAQGRRIDGNPLKPDFWSWSNLLSPVAAGLD